MNLKYIGLIILLSTLCFTLFFQKISFKSENIKDLGITKYIPSENEISLISNANTSDINKFIKNNIQNEKKEDFNILKNGIYSFLGFNFQENFKDIYDGEISLSIYNNDDHFKDLLLIIKVKDNKNINTILDIDNNLNKENKIIRFKRPEKINFLKYAYKTKENYIIFSSSEELINLSINNRKDILKQSILKNLPIELYNEAVNNKLIIISNENLINNILGKNFERNEHFITFLKYMNNKLNLKSYSVNNYKNINQEENNINFSNLQKEGSIILTNDFKSINNGLPFLKINDIQQQIIEEIKSNIIDKIFYSIDSENWLLAFKIIENKYNLLNNLDIFNEFNKNNIKVEDVNYYVFSKDKLSFKDNKLNYEKEIPIFTKELNNIIYFSNNILYLSNNKMLEKYAKDYLAENNIYNNQKFIDDQIYLNNSNIIRNFTYPIVNQINNFSNNLLNLKFKSLKASAIQRIPELTPFVFIESELEVF